jgi:hypothetical protein
VEKENKKQQEEIFRHGSYFVKDKKRRIGEGTISLVGGKYFDKLTKPTWCDFYFLFTNSIIQFLGN